MARYNELMFECAVDRLKRHLKSKPKAIDSRIVNKIIKIYGKKEYESVRTKNECGDIEREHIRKIVKAPEIVEFESLNIRKYCAPKVDILIPVYRGFDETLRCIYSVLKAKTNVAFELIVIDDCSPEPKLSNVLKNISTGRFTYIRNEKNIGFLRTMNKAMAIHVDRDVIWLNSDTEVFDYWLDRIINIASKSEKIATVTPISNNATINSYPLTLKDNSEEFIIRDAEIDEIAGEINKDIALEVPTGHGFCMFVNRKALEEVGYLDEDFNLGYGEENDLCQRFIEAGYTNVSTPSVFVRHYGSVSFKERATGLCRENLKILKNKHPKYNDQIKKFVREDPLRIYRIRLDAAIWFKSRNNACGTVVHICHRRGGGTQKFVDQMIGKLSKNGIDSLIFYPFDNKGVFNVDIEQFPNMKVIDFLHGNEEIKSVLLGCKAVNVHVHSIVDWNPWISFNIKGIRCLMGVPVTVTIHDYHWCCGRINLMRTNSNEFCNSYDESRCANCDKFSEGESTFINKSAAEEIFCVADKITVPNKDVSDRLKLVFGQKYKFDIVPHQDETDKHWVPFNKKGKPFVVAAIGGIDRAKGFVVLDKLGKYFKDKNFDAKVIIIGNACDDSENIEILGKYKQEKLFDILKKIKPSVLFLSSIWPETYSYVLSEMLCTGLPVASFNIGAPAERLEKMGLLNNLIPIEYKDNPEKIYKSLLNISNNCNGKYNYVENVTELDSYYCF